jgi:Tfp pilus assembly protein PilO
MKYSLPGFSKKLKLLSVVLMASFIVFYLLIIRVKVSDIRKAKAELYELDKKMTDVNIAISTVTQYKESTKDTYAGLSRLVESEVPSEPQVPELLSSIRMLADKHGVGDLAFSSGEKEIAFTAQEQSRRMVYYRMPIVVVMNVNWTNFIKLLGEFDNCGRLLKVNSILIKREESILPKVRAEVSMDAYCRGEEVRGASK